MKKQFSRHKQRTLSQTLLKQLSKLGFALIQEFSLEVTFNCMVLLAEASIILAGLNVDASDSSRMTMSALAIVC